MKITPLDIKKQDFKKVLRGLDPIEVETFLEMVSEEFESLIREKNTLSNEVLKLKTQLKDYQEVEKTFKESLMSAQQTINQSRENSQKEANLIIREAEIQAESHLPASLSIDEISLNTRALNALRADGLETVGDVLQRLEQGEDALLAITGVGQKALIEQDKQLRT